MDEVEISADEAATAAAVIGLGWAAFRSWHDLPLAAQRLLLDEFGGDDGLRDLLDENGGDQRMTPSAKRRAEEAAAFQLVAVVKRRESLR